MFTGPKRHLAMLVAVAALGTVVAGMMWVGRTDSSPSQLQVEGKGRRLRLETHGFWVHNIDSAKSLLDASEAVALVEPLDPPERLLREIDGVKFFAKPMRVVESIYGRLRSGQSILVIRPVYGVPRESQDYLRSRGYNPDEVEPSDDGSPPFDLPLYLLGLVDTKGFYGEDAWNLTSGLHSRVPFDSKDPRSAKAIIEGTPQTGDGRLKVHGSSHAEQGTLEVKWKGLTWPQVSDQLRQAQEGRNAA